MSISYSPQYRLLIVNVSPTNTTIQTIREVKSLMSLSCTLETDTNVGQLTATWADTDFTTFGDTVSRPKPMVLVQLWLTDRLGQWSIVWTGIADSITRTVNMGQSKTWSLQASSPYKLFNITLQDSASSVVLGFDYAVGIKATAVLLFAAKQVGYPGPFALLPAATGWGVSLALNQPGQKGSIDYTADAGANTYGAISTSVFISPAQQTYSAILQSLIADSEIEFFFNEMGQLIWRPLAYLQVSGNEKIIQKDSILNHTYVESDEGVLTTVYVRFGTLQSQLDQGVWNAPKAMEAALHRRAAIFYAPWIGTRAGANALAQGLGYRYSGNMHTSQLTIVADPTIKVGTTIRVPKFPDLMPVDNLKKTRPRALAIELTPWYYYYVYGITYNLQVGGQWTMTLDLRYGRDEKLQFPYLGYSPRLDDYIPSPGSLNTPISRVDLIHYDFDAQNNAVISTPFTVSVNKGLTSSTAVVDPSIIPPGSVIMVKDANGRAIGEYTTVAGNVGSGYSITLPSNPGNNNPVKVTIETQGQAPTPDTGVNAGSDPYSSPSSPGDPNSGLGNWQDTPPPSPDSLGKIKFWPNAPAPPTSVTQGFGHTSYKEFIYPYYPAGTQVPDKLNIDPNFHTGVDLGYSFGTPLYSVVDGTVVASMPHNNWAYGGTYLDTGYNGGYGNMLTIQSGPLYILFGHMRDPALPPVNANVKAGQLVGYVGSTGYSGGPHLHLGIYDANAPRPSAVGGTGRFVDPLVYLRTANYPPAIL